MNTRVFLRPRAAYAAVVLSTAVATMARAQHIPGAVLAKHEPHHHLAYEDEALRVLRVRVPAHDSTLLHEHDPDYFWISLGPSEVVNAKLGSPDAVVKSADLSIHYTPGNFAHVARNPGNVPFDNITVELLGAQAHPRNECEDAIAGAPLACPTGGRASPPRVDRRPAFTTDQLEVALVTIAPGATLTGPATRPAPWVITLDSADAGRGLRESARGTARRPASSRGAAWEGGVWRAPSRRGWSLVNAGASPVRVLMVTPVRR